MFAAIRRVFSARETGILLATVIVIAVATAINPAFVFSHDGWRDLLLTPSILVLVAIGQAFVIITRSVDLSVGSVVGLTAYLTGRLFIDLPGIPAIVVVLCGVALGAVLGFINGALVAYARVPALVITLGTMYAYRGITCGGRAVTASTRPTCPRRFVDSAPDRSCRFRSSRSSPQASSSPPPGTCATSAPVARCTPSDLTRPPRTFTDCP